MRVPIPVASTKGGAFRNEVQKLVNCYIEQSTPRSEEGTGVLGTPGSFGIANTGQASIRAMRYWGDQLYAVSGGGLYRVGSDGSATLLTPVPATGRVMMAEVPSYLIVLAGGEIFTWDKTNFATVTIPSFTGVPSTIPDSIAVVGLSLVIGLQGSDFYCWSEPNQPLTIPGANIARAERNGDATVTVAEDHNELLLIGRKSIEVLYDTGAATGRFQSVGSGVIERGTAAAESVAKNDNTLFWLGDDRIVYRLDGRTPIRISSHGMETDISKYNAVGDAFGVSYTWNGHKFYAITFPSTGITWEIDLNTGSAHERRTWQKPYWYARCVETGYNNDTIIGSAFEGSIYCQSDTYYTEAGRPIERVTRTPYIHADRRRFTVARLEVDIDTGEAVISGAGSDPQIVLRYSENGKQWSSERRRSLGRYGEFNQKVVFTQLGQARRRSYELRTTDPHPWRITAMHQWQDLGDV